MSKEVLDKCGWDVECVSPFEIRHRETGDFASGAAAEIVEEYCNQHTSKPFGELDVGDFFYEKDAADGVFMMKTPLATAGGQNFNCVTVNASPNDIIREYVAFKDDYEEVYRK